MLASRGPGQCASYIVRSTRPNGRPSTRYGSASAAFARLVVVETACRTSNVLASWVTRLPVEPPMAGARTVSQAEILPRATLANDLDLRSATINEEFDARDKTGVIGGQK
jgi:hypothetical protein